MSLLTAALARGAAAEEPAAPMRFGVDDAGRPRPVYDDPKALQAIREIGFDFLSWKMGGPPEMRTREDLEAIRTSEDGYQGAWDYAVEGFKRVDAWAAGNGLSVLVNNDAAPPVRGDAAIYGEPGLFFIPPEELVRLMAASPRCLGLCYDEVAHAVNYGGWISANSGVPGPYFYDADGDSLPEAYRGNLANLETLMRTSFGGWSGNGRLDEAGPVVGGEYVFPILNHLFARAGVVPMPKLLKESVTPIAAGVAMGAARQYGLELWYCVDLWGLQGYPSHSPEDLASALRFAYWTGADATYIENLNYKGSLYSETEDGVELSPLGEAARDFGQRYRTENPRSIAFQDFRPSIVIVRFPDSDWGQVDFPGWLRNRLYGGEGLERTEQTSYWFRIWHVITHGRSSPESINYNAGMRNEPFRFFHPANNAAVYDHLADDPALYEGVELVFLAGIHIPEPTMACLDRLVREDGLTVVAPNWLAPKGMAAGEPIARYQRGKGAWLVTDAVDHPEVVAALRPFLGEPDEMRYVFGKKEVVFRRPSASRPISVEVRAHP